MAFQLAMVIPIIAKFMRPDNPNNEKEIVLLISFGKASPSPSRGDAATTSGIKA